MCSSSEPTRESRVSEKERRLQSKQDHEANKRVQYALDLSSEELCIY